MKVRAVRVMTIHWRLVSATSTKSFDVVKRKRRPYHPVMTACHTVSVAVHRTSNNNEFIRAVGREDETRRQWAADDLRDSD